MLGQILTLIRTKEVQIVTTLFNIAICGLSAVVVVGMIYITFIE